MSSNNQELEVKYIVRDLLRYEEKLKLLGAMPVQARTHEINLRFDTPDQLLTSSYQVLRLRQDTQARLTYKGPGELLGGVRLRREIEFSVSDFQSAQSFLEALGYQVTFMYEKYRAVYKLGDLFIMLDEMPIGYFLELEGPNPDIIHANTQKLSLNWDRRILDSYTFLFNKIREACGLTFRDLSFENFQGISVTPDMMDIIYADLD